MTDYYSLLRISPQASKLDIINAYRRAKLTFRKDSLAVYSLYSEEELAQIRDDVEKAYAVLSNREKRQAYDAEHGYAATASGAETLLSEGRPEDMPSVEEAMDLAGGEEAGQEDSGEDALLWGDNVVRLHHRKERDYDPDLERRIQSAEAFSGRFLREVREYRGVELEDVAEHTRISIAYLKAIENEDMQALPARAYLKGYIGQYAAEIDLEPHRVVQGYPPLTGKLAES